MANYDGTPNNDSWYGTNDNDTARGNDGDDELHGEGGDDQIEGNAGNDVIFGGEGGDRLTGGVGNDIIDGGAGGDSIYFDSLLDVSSGDQVNGGADFDLIVTTDRSYSADGIDLTQISITSIEGYRTVDGRARITFAQFSEATSLSGIFNIVGSGNFDLTGGKLQSGALYLDSGNDWASLVGTTTDISLTGGGGDDTLLGGNGHNSLIGGEGDDLIEGNDGDDNLRGQAGNDVLRGGAGADTFYDDAGVDRMEGGAGDDVFWTTIEFGSLAGGVAAGDAGYDQLVIDATPQQRYSVVDLGTFTATGMESISERFTSLIIKGGLSQLAQFTVRLRAYAVELADAGTLTLGLYNGSPIYEVSSIYLSGAGNTVDATAVDRGYAFRGAGGNDTVRAGGQSDTINGGDGNDLLLGGGGFDVIDGGKGVDTIDGGAGDDALVVTWGEAIEAGDVFRGGSGTDGIDTEYTGSASPDFFHDFSIATLVSVERIYDSAVRLTVSQANAIELYQNVVLRIANAGVIDFTNRSFAGEIRLSDAGNTIYMPQVDYYNLRIWGGNGKDQIYGTPGSDIFDGGAGNDLLAGGAGANQLTGGLGDDVFVVTSTGNTLIEQAGQGRDTVRLNLAGGNFTLADNIEDIEVQSNGTTARGNGLVNVIISTGTGNALYGEGGDDSLAGGNGTDTLDGGAGNDRLNGGAGNDTMSGGSGNDLYFVDSSGDVTAENAGDGTDEVRATAAAFALGDNIENLVFDGGGAFAGTGNALANFIVGGAGDDTLIGLAGNDTLQAAPESIRSPAVRTTTPTS